MTGVEICYLTLTEVSDRIAARALSSEDVLKAVIAHTEAVEDKVHAYITTMFDSAMAEARKADREIAGGRLRGPLHGIPIGLKDNYWTRGVRTTAGSELLADFVPAEDGAVVSKLREAGAVITGKLNMHELAIGGTTANPHFGTTHNPWSLDRIPGGSSGGSAAAVAAGMCYAALGTDTVASIRHPAACCGVVGLKPTFGRVSTYGIVPLSWSLDHAGPITRTVDDAAVVMNAIAGYDPRDSGSANVEVPDFAGRLAADAPYGLGGIRIGLPRSWFFEPLDPEVRSAVESAVQLLQELGAHIEEIEFPAAPQAPILFPFLSRPEAASFQSEFLRNRPEDYGDVRWNVELGEMILATDYIRAQRLRNAMRQELAGILRKVDALVTPTMRAVAYPIGRPFTTIDAQPIDLFQLSVGLTAPFSLTGSPAVSVPCGFDSNGLPIGLQIAGRDWDERTVLRIAATYQDAAGWHKRHPVL
jgi:aspartyl-tRNA(Asn)/glutamyl-tRNA(Gln) amidotransferase subunit A